MKVDESQHKQDKKRRATTNAESASYALNQNEPIKGLDKVGKPAEGRMTDYYQNNYSHTMQQKDNANPLTRN